VNLEKIDKLRSILQDCDSVAVSFSGGVDSTVLCVASFVELGSANCLAVFAKTEFTTDQEAGWAKQFCSDRDIAFELVEIKQLAQRSLADDTQYLADNPIDRCYICKRNILEKTASLAHAHGLATVVEGSNLDDLTDNRPGRQAITECGARSPLLEAGFTKLEVRELAREFQLPNADKPADACLATRFAFNQRLTLANLKLVELAERYLHDLGIRQVRVRVDQIDPRPSARIETDRQGMIMITEKDLMQQIADGLSELGFINTSLDMAGYRRGSMNASN
jgi:uncharacterized protein